MSPRVEAGRRSLENENKNFHFTHSLGNKAMSHLEKMFSAERPPLFERGGDVASERVRDEGGIIEAASARAQEAAEREAVLVLERIGRLPDKPAEGAMEQENNAVDLDSGERFVEAQKVLEKIDLSVLTDIFSEMYRKSGLRSEPTLTPLKNIEVVAGTGGESDSVEKKITIGADFSPWTVLPHKLYSNEWRGEKKFTRGRLRADILSVFMHEQAHAVSRNIRREEGKMDRLTKEIRSFFFGRQKLDNSSGYQMGGIEKGNFRTRHLSFNEAVTDKIGEKAYDEYLKRTGEKEFFSDHAGAKYGEGYVGARAMVDSMIEILSASLDVPSDTVWESIVQGYMCGVDLDESELKDAFDEIFTPGIRENMAKWASKESELPVGELNELSKKIVHSDAGRGKVRAAYEKFQLQIDLHRESERI